MRRARERALEARAGELRAQGATCLERQRQSNDALVVLRAEVRVSIASATAFALRADAAHFDQQAAGAVADGWFRMPLDPGQWELDAAPLRRLSAVTGAIALTRPSAVGHADLPDIGRALAAIQQKLDEAPRAADSSAYLRLPSLVPPGNCFVDCYNVLSERAMQRRRRLAATADLQRSREELIEEHGRGRLFVSLPIAGHDELKRAAGRYAGNSVALALLLALPKNHDLSWLLSIP